MVRKSTGSGTFPKIFFPSRSGHTITQLRHFGRGLKQRPEYQGPEGAEREVLMIESIRPQSLRCRENERRKEHQCLPCDRAEEVDELGHWSIELAKQENNCEPDQGCSDDWFNIPSSCVLVRHDPPPQYVCLPLLVRRTRSVEIDSIATFFCEILMATKGFKDRQLAW
jgi:hypothetical protein